MSAIKTALAGALCHPSVGRLLSALFQGRIPSLRFGALRLDTRAPSVSPRIVAMIFWGIYESAELRFVRRYLRPDLDVLELGSSLGAVSCRIARRQQAGRKLVCVEANADLLPTLRRNVATHGRKPVEVLNRAIGYDGPTVRLQRGPDNISGRVTRNGADDTEEVPASTLSALLEEQGLGDYALVSDIEGAEAGFIERDAAALSHCQQVVIELHDAEGSAGPLSVDDLAALLVERHGFALRDRHGPVCVFERPTGPAGPAGPAPP